MYSIGKSTQGKDLWMLHFGTEHTDRRPPSILLLGNLHGDEAVGRDLVLQLSAYLCDHSSENFIKQVGGWRSAQVNMEGRISVLKSLGECVTRNILLNFT